MRRREAIVQEINENLRVNKGVLGKVQVKKYLEEFGPRNTFAVMDAGIRGSDWPEPIAESSWFYRQYRQAFALYGERRSFFSRSEYEATLLRWGRLSSWHALLLIEIQSRERYLRDQLFIDQILWKDLQPATPPLRPAGFFAPQPQEYHGPERDLLKWGANLNPEMVGEAANQPKRWKKAAADLARMALDEGLLAGWPGEPPSWAPYYAVRLLGKLGAAEFAATLAALTNRADDWLSDCLPEAWASMGKKAMPALWEIIDNQKHVPEMRALAISGLYRMAGANPGLRTGVVKGFIDRLISSDSNNAVLNAHLVMNLIKLNAEESDGVNYAAFERGAVDNKLFEMGSVDIHDYVVAGRKQ